MVDAVERGYLEKVDMDGVTDVGGIILCPSLRGVKKDFVFLALVHQYSGLEYE